ncbi:peptidase S9 prolyl oligopeptidase [Calothrix sp. NIES-4071]|nr:peptidase S9 prolyl oligopeptidase [Calothrix sp. NIES-4071]BAZ64155.1 peptidase S9 prolyl oligopeptidase [Calothrix sp. NIES-4105]
MHGKAMTPKVAPYGSWKSPITTDLITGATIGLGQIALDGEDIYWTELRPTEKGRNVIVKRAPDGNIRDVTPEGFNVRTRVHEYGGGAYFVSNGTVYFSNFADQRLYSQTAENASALTPEIAMRYGDGIVDATRRRIICVCEDHTAGEHEPINKLVAINLENSDIQTLVFGNDFYTSPRLSPDGSRLAWLTWNHPKMPWDSAELWVGDVQNDGSIGNTKKIAGGANESVCQPEWSSDGTLYFILDRTGWWNIYRTVGDSIENLTPIAAEFGKPQWILGACTYGIESPNRIICSYTEQGTWKLASLDTTSGKLETFDLPYTEISSLQVAPGKVLFNGGAPTQPTELVLLDLATLERTVLRRASEVTVDTGYLSQVEGIEFPTTNGKTAFAIFYPPQNQDYIAPEGEKPPLLVKSHGGPTAATSTSLSLSIQYWTSRGIAVLDVNYGGSTGYGREYRQRLEGTWGIVDVDDCANGAKYLVQQGLVDGNRLAIAGGSAGGYTTLCALTFRDTFKAGASYYGVSDLEALARDTHKFESRYLDGLIGAYPERKDLYIERSPVHFTEKLACPVIFFQGLEDKIVPPNQAEIMVEALQQKGLPVAYVAFEGEQHGFRSAENIKRALEGEIYFYSRVFNFDLADNVQTVKIDNL